MWICPKCKRQFKNVKQPHTCKKILLEEHFKNKDKAKELFDYLVKQINKKIGKCQIVSIPCCIHLFGNYDFLAALPKKEGIEIRFSLDRKLDSPRLKQYVKMSSEVFKNCFYLNSKKEIDKEFIAWLKESYNLKES